MSGGSGTCTQPGRQRLSFPRGRLRSTTRRALSARGGYGNVARKDVSWRSGDGWRAFWHQQWRRHFYICHGHSLTSWLMCLSLAVVFWCSSMAERKTSGHSGAPTIPGRLIGYFSARPKADPFADGRGRNSCVGGGCRWNAGG